MIAADFKEGRFTWEVFNLSIPEAAQIEARLFKQLVKEKEFVPARIPELVNQFSENKRDYALFKLGMLFGMISTLKVGEEIAIGYLRSKIALAKILKVEILADIIKAEMLEEERRAREMEKNNDESPDIR